MSRIALIDYGAGNIRSVHRALTAGGGDVVVTDDPEVVRRAGRVALPGQGAFADCMSGLESRDGLIEALEEAVLRRGAPFLGICVGMQLLAETGLEHTERKGLGWIGGVCRELRPGPGLTLPHTGWNEVRPMRGHPVFDALAPARHCYFNHSFVLEPPREAIAATTEHGETFCCGVARDNLVGVQFHPEKSQTAGLAVVSNFVTWSP
ncbi:MAG TPA: imidazole glycerol phosphate synthase subunit HisH [Caulobacterales bacterium]|nr:imidazole glycerol phosphate synthase subunit HisH [Caulobacterales bacterium]